VADPTHPRLDSGIRRSGSIWDRAAAVRSLSSSFSSAIAATVGTVPPD
jgi:hypothetical protein